MGRVKELKEIHEDMLDIADRIRRILEPREEEPVKTYTIEEVRKILADKSRAGFREDVKALLEKYGSKKLSEIQEKDYQALVEDAEKLK